ncbi:type 2 lanthipeptide synthetase LanM family protein [Streptomyces sp. MUM 16J]|uniref:type 2 lanthipeptide synthetase LanM family protein n=1 Tax=Streptomyces sp. MUM 16J TaxID=2791988 RepID=UPI0008FC9A69|nr:type 2 lanthipeptide synthetase LanM family protein [Streptomyces sp. MUM 16J]MCH0558108.1 type 2 lantipeptide synthetase LanM family protein [Streptomyces sp. MUM 16J]
MSKQRTALKSAPPPAVAPWAVPRDPAGFLHAVLARVPEEPSPPHPADAGSVRQLAHPFGPFLIAAEALVRRRRPDPGTDLDAVWAGVADGLAERLADLAGRVLVRELREARTAGRLRGRTGPERYLDFLTRLAGRPALTDLFARYPVLPGLLAREAHGTARALSELLDRLRRDRTALDSVLLPGACTARLTAVDLGAGDRHGGGRSVAVLRFADGRRLVYKPRPLGLHQCWNGLLDWLRSALPDLAPRGVAVLPRGEYGWAEFVAPTPCADEAEVGLFYRRQGALLALCHAIDATDLHAENLIACGGHPVVIDVETLFHPAWQPCTDVGDDPATAALDDSVARTGLLPWVMSTEAGDVDVSAFGGGGPDAVPLSVRDWAGLGTDTLRLEPRPAPAPGGANRPTLHGVAVDPLDHGGDLRAGFARGYEAVLARAGELTRPGGVLARFAGQPTRVVMRPSHVYATMLAESVAPERLASREAHAAAFAALTEETGLTHLRDLAPYERADLLDGDLPLFTGRTDSTCLTTSRGRPLPFTPAATGLDTARAKITRMSPDGLRGQDWLIAATLATKRGGAARFGEPTGAASSEGAAATGARGSRSRGAGRDGAAREPVEDRAESLELARRLGDDLVAGAEHNAARTNWIGLETLDDGGSWTVAQLGGGLADGYTGTALFLAQLAALTGNEQYGVVAAHAARALPSLVTALSRYPVLAREVGPGGFFGLGGICYGLVRLAGLLDDATLRGALEPALTALAASAGGAGAGVGADSSLDIALGVGSGLAGGLAALHAVHAETGDPEAARLAEVFAARLAEAAGAGQAGTGSGFLDGSAGVWWAAGLREGDGMRPGRGRGASSCDGPGAPPAAFTRPGGDLDEWAADGADTGWCRGLAGAVLARGGEAGGEPLVRRFIEAVADRPPLADQSLCHGELGVIEALIELERAGRTDVRPLRAAAGRRLADAIHRHGARCGTPDRVPTPGLLHGTAGIGYGLLRLHSPQQVPSVLLLRPGRPQ